MEKDIYNSLLAILKEELVPAMGCTEPIAVAYAGALARKTLGCLPEETVLFVSGNIIKNVKFREGVYYEDTDFTPILFSNTKKLL